MHPMLNTAVKAARRAGAIINRASLDLDLVQVTRKSHNDFVTEVDKAAEAAVIETIMTAYPDHSILAEESGMTRGRGQVPKDPDDAPDFLWVIDPLDGTTNFIHGFPQYCVSIALAQRGQVTQGVVYDPTRNDLFTASKGRGAFLNDRRIRVSKRAKIAEALIGTGFPSREFDRLDAYVKMFRHITEHSAGLRRPGAAALDLAYLAAGRLDGFFEMGLKPWDIAAGSLLVTEAGGLVGDFQGNSDYMHSGDLLAATPKVFALLVQQLGPLHQPRIESEAVGTR
jgi:myo-inositol-1(or 4)-monophosphatase